MTCRVTRRALRSRSSNFSPFQSERVCFFLPDSVNSHLAQTQLSIANMDLASTLIRSVVRAFYETRHILVVDALFIHSVYEQAIHHSVRGEWHANAKSLRTAYTPKISRFSWGCNRKICGSCVGDCAKTG